MVHQHLLEVVGAVTPVLLQVEGQVRRDHLPASVGHPACLVQFSHARVNERHSCCALPPSLDELEVFAPLVDAFSMDAVLEEEGSSMVAGVEAKEVSPEEFVNEVLGARILNRVVDDSLVDLSD